MTSNNIVFKSPIDTVVIIVLFLKIMLIMNFDDFFIPQFFSSLFSTFLQTPAAYLWTLRVTLVCRGTPVENPCI
jgi:hypothetical protein